MWELIDWLICWLDILIRDSETDMKLTVHLAVVPHVLHCAGHRGSEKFFRSNCPGRSKHQLKL